VHRSERGENPDVPIQPVRLIRILDAAPQITQKVKRIIHGRNGPRRSHSLPKSRTHDQDEHQIDCAAQSTAGYADSIAGLCRQ
jgi:hypothetical protein